MIKIALADDSMLMRSALSSLYRQLGMHVLFEAPNGRELLDCIMTAPVQPDIVSLDVRMPLMDGPKTTKHISSAYPHIRIIAVSLFCHEKHLVDMLTSGARAYLTKSAEAGDVREAINTVMAGDIYIHPEISRTWNVMPEDLHPDLNKKIRTRLLNKREYVFLAHCATDLSYKQIAEIMEVEYKTIDTYRAAVARKLNIQTRGGLAAYAVRYGLTADL